MQLKHLNALAGHGLHVQPLAVDLLLAGRMHEHAVLDRVQATMGSPRGDRAPTGTFLLPLGVWAIGETPSP